MREESERVTHTYHLHLYMANEWSANIRSIVPENRERARENERKLMGENKHKHTPYTYLL